MEQKDNEYAKILEKIDSIERQIRVNFLRTRGLLQALIDKDNMHLEAVDTPQRKEE